MENSRVTIITALIGAAATIITGFKEEIALTLDMTPKHVSLDVSGVVQLKMQIVSTGNGSYYGIGNPTLK